MIVTRSSSIVEYLYLRKIQDTGDDIFGICVVLNGVLTYKLIHLFKLFERKFEQLVTEGCLLCFDNDGRIKVDEHSWIFPDAICDDYNKQFNDSFSENYSHFEQLPPLNYSTREESVTVCIADGDSSIRDAINAYNTVVVVKSPVSSSLTFNGYSVKLARLSNDLEQKNALIGELQEKMSAYNHSGRSGALPWVLLSVLIVLVVFAAVFGVITIHF